MRRPRCLQCLRNGVRTAQPRRPFSASTQVRHPWPPPSEPVPAPARPPLARPSTAPKPIIDIKHIRQNPTLHQQNCLDRNYTAQASYPARIIALHEQWQSSQRNARALRERSNLLRGRLANPAAAHDEDLENDADPASRGVVAPGRNELLAQARDAKAQLAAVEAAEGQLKDEMETLALAIPNLTGEETPRGAEPRVLCYINNGEERGGEEEAPALSDAVWRSHVHIGAELGLLDFAGAAAASGWGWYYLTNEGAQLEEALVAFALATVARQPGWRRVSPPSMVYAHIAAACGFQPRDQGGEQQIYAIAQSASDPRPTHVLAGTAEIALAGMRADTTLEAADLPIKTVGASPCFRAEAGARGAETKGLYRVHEFTKVEMFAWTPPAAADAADVFDEMVDIQTDILHSLGLRCRVLEMPSADLGASATRKIDIEAFFPSRTGIGGSSGGWGEVTSASICTDYQTRRLATRLRLPDGKLGYPWTVNGTALAVPRVLAAVLENGWDEADMSVTIPECLRPWMDGEEKITLRQRPR